MEADLSATDLNTSELTTGSVISGRYHLDYPIGEGGFGQIWHATDTNTNQAVALKILSPAKLAASGDVETEVARFQREMTLIARLKHPNIVKLIDSGRLADGMLFAVMEYIEGVELGDLLAKEGPLSVRETTRLMTQVLDALCCAHIEGVVHRDIKPANIMVTSTGGRRNAMVLDFGIGSVVEEARGADFQRLTQTGLVHGTPAYMAPEQLRGKLVSPASDVYAWGLVFVESLTGRTVMHADSAADIIVMQLGQTPVDMPPALRNSELGRVLSIALAKRVEERFPTAKETLDVLESIHVTEIPGLSGQQGMPYGPQTPGGVPMAPGTGPQGFMPTPDGFHAMNTVQQPSAEHSTQGRTWFKGPAGIVALLGVLVVVGVIGAVLAMGGEEKEASGDASARAAEDPKPETPPPPETMALEPPAAPAPLPAAPEPAPEGEAKARQAELQSALLRGLTANQTGDYDTALEAFGEAMGAGPEGSSELGPVLVGLGNAYKGLGRVEDAKAHYQRCIDELPDSPAARQASGYLAELDKPVAKSRRSRHRADEPPRAQRRRRRRASGVQVLID